MVLSATSLGRSGLSDWLWQRVSAIVMTLFTAYLVYFLCQHPALNYNVLEDLFSSNCFKLAAIFTLLSIVAHAWIGLWTVTTDYIKCACMRVGLQLLIIFSLIAMLFWGFWILWSV